MSKSAIVLILATCTLTACNKSSSPPPKLILRSVDALQQKLIDYAGISAKDCGRLDVHAAETQLKTASDCAISAARNRTPFFLAYDMPGMSVGIAGNNDAKLYSVQSQNGSITAGTCPSQLRIASSGRVTCFAPGDMGAMGSGHVTVAPGTPNPHGNNPSSPH